MAKFNYKFQSVLSIKEKIEEQKKIELGNAMKALHHEENILKEFVHKRNNYEKEFYKKKDSHIKARSLSELSNGIKYYMDETKAQEEVVDIAKKFVEKKRKALQEAVHEKKIYEKLKEKVYEVYQEEMKIEENKLLDEVVSFNYNIDAK